MVSHSAISAWHVHTGNSGRHNRGPSACQYAPCITQSLLHVTQWIGVYTDATLPHQKPGWLETPSAAPILEHIYSVSTRMVANPNGFKLACTRCCEKPADFWSSSTRVVSVAAATEMCGRQVLAGVEYRVRIPQLPYDLLRTVSPPSSSLHRGFHAPVGPLDLHNMWISISTAGHRLEPVFSVGEFGVDRDDCHYH
jgi:hypothetical protein